jgi:hypothetical protein
MSTATREIIRLCEALPEDKRAAVVDLPVFCFQAKSIRMIWRGNGSSRMTGLFQN